MTKRWLKRVEKLACVILLIATVLSATSFVPRTIAAMVIVGVNPDHGKVGTQVEITANLTTLKGTYQLLFDERLVANGTAEANSVITNFTVPDSTAGSHVVKITDIATSDNATSTFTVETGYSVDVPFGAAAIQEGDSVPMRMNITGGNAGQTYSANVTVKAPTNLTYTNMTNVSTSDFGNGTVTVSYAGDFPIGANTSFVGSYAVFFNSTLANNTFLVGLTNATEYHRSQTVNVKASYGSDELVTLTIIGKDVSQTVNLTDPSGLISYNWTVPANAAIGSYAVKAVSVSGPTIKSPSDAQNFTVPGFTINVTARNLANETVSSVAIKATEGGTIAGEVTTDSAGLAVLTLEVGNFSLEGYFTNEKVGNLTIEVNNSISVDLVCNLTNLRVQVVSISNGAEMNVPEAGVFLAPDNRSFVTGINGTLVINSLLPNRSYSLNSTRYGASFNVTSISSLLVNDAPVAWFDVRIVCPNLNMQVTVTKANGQVFADALIRAQELLGSPLFEGYTDVNGVISFDAPFGRYKVQALGDQGTVLNETTIDLFENQNVNLNCSLFGLLVSVRVVDYFGQGIGNVEVSLKGQGQPVSSQITGSDGLVTFDNVIGGQLEAAVYLAGSSSLLAAQDFTVEHSTTLQIKVAKYAAFAGMLVEVSQLVTVIFILLAVVLVLGVEIYRHKRSRPEKVENESKNKES